MNVIQEAERTAEVRIEPGRPYGFFTDTTLCIGCKACEVACKAWNQLPAEPTELTGLSYDNTRSFSATTWRHVRFVEQLEEGRFGTSTSTSTSTSEHRGGAGGSGDATADIVALARAQGSDPDASKSKSKSMPADVEPWGHFLNGEAWADPGSRWLLMSDVCKHCVQAPCLEACPTGSIIRTEYDSVLVQQDICNGCGYCQTACPFGVVQVDKESDGKAHKCTLCYDRLKDGLEPACAKVCPTESIQFGPVDDLKERARVRAAELRDRGIGAYLYGDAEAEPSDRGDTSALDGLNCFFLLIDDPEVYNLPPVAIRPSKNTPRGLATGLLTAAGLTIATLLAFREAR